ncbi:MAG: DnaJ domain-containing protein [Deltaproteobacteria bacterium]|nr:DnaJ domain-containing protein [Deltaproteobacteria bacterium]
MTKSLPVLFILFIISNNPIWAEETAPNAQKIIASCKKDCPESPFVKSGEIPSRTKTKQSDKPFVLLSPKGNYLVKISRKDHLCSIQLLNTAHLSKTANWDIPNFTAHSVEFSGTDPLKLLIADDHQIFVYRISDNQRELILHKRIEKGRVITRATFDVEKEKVLWTTKDMIYSIDLKDNSEQPIGHTDTKLGDINSLTSLKNDQLAISQINNKQILIFNKNNSTSPNSLTGHESMVIGTQSPGGQTLFSIDRNKELLVWNLDKKEITDRIHLGNEVSSPKVIGVGLDEQKQSLIVLYEKDNKQIGQKYNLIDLIQGKTEPLDQNIIHTKSGRLYNALDKDNPWQKEILPYLNTPKSGNKKPAALKFPDLIDQDPGNKLQPNRNTPYQLASIEAEHQNYDQALSYIKKVTIQDPEYSLSRELQKKVFNEIEFKNSLSVAQEQYRIGNFETAKILFEAILAKNPDHKIAINYLALTQKQTLKNLWKKIGFSALTFLILTLIGLFGWKKRVDLIKLLATGRGEESLQQDFHNQNNKDQDQRSSRGDFFLKHQDTKAALLNFKDSDKIYYFQDEYLQIISRFKEIESKSKYQNPSFSNLIRELDAIIEQLKQLSTKKKTTHQQSEKNSEKQSFEGEQQKKQGETNKDDQSQSKDHEKNNHIKEEDASDYFEILNVNRYTPPEEIKKAYKKKIKQYHPDKHNASEFDWIKQEADRRTKRLQEAYDVLIDPNKRELYIQKMKS